MTATGEIIEHIVLFKMKPDADPSKINQSINGLNSLSSLPQVLYLTAGPIHNSHSSSDLHFTHILHVRFKSKHDLSTYTPHPSHLAVVQQTKPIVGDIMALDWVSIAQQDPAPGFAIRVALLKLKEEKEKEIEEVLRVIGEIKDEYPAINQFSIGENFSLDRAKGFSIGMIMFFPAVSELTSLDLNSRLKEKLGDGIESSVVVDYVIPAPEPEAACLELFNCCTKKKCEIVENLWSI